MVLDPPVRIARGIRWTLIYTLLLGSNSAEERRTKDSKTMEEHDKRVRFLMARRQDGRMANEDVSSRCIGDQPFSQNQPTL